MKQRFFPAPEFLNQAQVDGSNSSTESFHVPPKVRIRTRYAEDDIFVDTSSDIWKHDRYCSIDWTKCSLKNPVLGTFRQFIWHRLASASPKTAEVNFRDIAGMQNHLSLAAFPWTEATCKSILAGCKDTRAFFSFRLFYRWAALREISGFSQDVSLSLDDLASPEFEPYRSVKFRENVLTPAEETQLLHIINDPRHEGDYFSFQDNLIAHLSWELGCRAEQIAGIEHQHFVEVLGPNGIKFSHVKLIRLKQRSYTSFYRNRVVSDRLALKLHKFIKLKIARFGNANDEQPLFSTLSGKRLKREAVGLAIADTFAQAGGRGGNSTLLRHNMAQKLADQGTPADLISDMLDHTTKIAARHYVGATPEIGRIKARALGRNSTYQELMALMTGAPILRERIQDGRQIVKGVVATRYIGNIGACGLDADTACNKNPIYSCYTCRKFNPFIDGEHANVVSALRTEIQILLNQSRDLHENKAVLQLEQTIEYAERAEHLCAAAAKGDGNAN